MEKKKVVIIGLGILLVISIILLIISIVNKPEKKESYIDGIDVPHNKEVLKDVTIGNFKITNVSLITMEGISTFKARVYNNSNEILTIKKLIVVFDIGKEEIKMEILNNAKIAPQDFTYVSLSSEKDLSKVEKIDYILE